MITTQISDQAASPYLASLDEFVIAVWLDYDLVRWFPVADDTDIAALLATFGFTLTSEWSTQATADGRGRLVATAMATRYITTN